MLAGRLADGLRRRVRYAWRRLRRGRRPSPVEAALRRLLLGGPQEDAALPTGLTELRPLAPAATPVFRLGPSPQFIGPCLETLLSLGCREPARRWAVWLAAQQRPDGSLPAPNEAGTSLSNTGAALQGWLAVLDDVPELEQPARRAAVWLRSRVEQLMGSSSPTPSSLSSHCSMRAAAGLKATFSPLPRSCWTTSAGQTMLATRPAIRRNDSSIGRRHSGGGETCRRPATFSKALFAVRRPPARPWHGWPFSGTRWGSAGRPTWLCNGWSGGRTPAAGFLAMRVAGFFPVTGRRIPWP